MKRITTILLIAVISISLFAIPAAAAERPNHFYIPFTLLTFEDDHGYVSVKFNLNDVPDRDTTPTNSLTRIEFSDQDREAEISIGDIVNNAAQSSAKILVSDHMQNLSSVNYELYAEDFVIPSSVMNNNTYYLVPQNEDAMLQHNISISFAVSRMELEYGLYVTKTYYGYATASFVNGFDIMKAIYNELPDEVLDDQYLRFNWISVSVDNNRSGNGLPGFTFTLRGTGSAVNPPSLSDWVRQFNMRQLVYNAPDIEDVDFTSWLSTSLRSVLDFELWPGMTLDVLIRFVVTAGLLLWFITMLI